MGFDERDADVGQDDALPSVEMTMMFLALCDLYGSHEAAVAAVSRGRRAGVSGLPDRHDWPEWTAAQMRAAVEYLQEETDRIRSTAPATTLTVRVLPDGGRWRW